MSTSVYPTLPGLSFGVMRTPVWSTRIQRASSGRELRSSNYSYPLWRYTLGYELLRAASAYNELQTLLAFFNARSGSFDSFYFTDPDSNSVTSSPFGTGNGTTTQFQLTRSIGGYAEPVFALNGAPSIYVAGVLKTSGTDYTLTNGMVTFTVAPANGAALTWTGSYYMICRFALDIAETNKFMRDLWEAKKIELVTVKQ